MPVILVVEDEPVILDVVSRVLAGQGYEVFTAADGLTALKIAEQSHLDLILLDIYLPVLDGRRFVQAYRARPGPHAPILLMTGAGYARERATALGVAGCLDKPFDPKELRDKVAEVVGPPAEATREVWSEVWSEVPDQLTHGWSGR